MATLVHSVNKQFRRCTTTRNLNPGYGGELHIVGLQDDASVHKAGNFYLFGGHCFWMLVFFHLGITDLTFF